MSAIKLHTNEYVPYQKMYIDLVADKPINTLLATSLKEFVSFLGEIPSSKFTYAYEAGKWTINDVLLHMIDTERIFQYRALRFSREDKTDLPGFSENDFVPHSNANSRTVESLLVEYNAVRMSTITLYKTFSDATLQIIGNASGSTMSVRALGYLIVGHQQHHINVIKERYL